MTLKPRVLILTGAGILSLAGAIAVQAATELPQTGDAAVQRGETITHTVQGNLLASSSETASVPCNQIQVDAAIKSRSADHTGNFPKEVLGATAAQGTTLGEGCTYRLTFSYLPSLQLPAFSEYRISAETPVIKGEYGEFIAGYTDIVSPPFPAEFDMKF